MNVLKPLRFEVDHHKKQLNVLNTYYLHRRITVVFACISYVDISFRSMPISGGIVLRRCAVMSPSSASQRIIIFVPCKVVNSMQIITCPTFFEKKIINMFNLPQPLRMNDMKTSTV